MMFTTEMIELFTVVPDRDRERVTEALLSDDNPGVRVRAIDSLARARHPDLMPVMRRLARDDADPYIRRRSGAIADEMYASVNR